MFNRILENKIIGDRITNFNSNAGKLATQWIDKFRHSLDLNDDDDDADITLASNSNNATPTRSNIQGKTIAATTGSNHSSVQQSYSETSLIETMSTSTAVSEANSNFYHFNNNANNCNNNNTVNNSAHHNGAYSNASSTINEFLYKTGDEYFSNGNVSAGGSSNKSSSFRDPPISLNAYKSKGASISIDAPTLSAADIVSPKLLHKANVSSSSVQTSPAASHHNRVLVRQSTDLTCQFPFKPFQRINSETVEIPGLNVKVVRYRIEDDLGKIEPHMYIKYGNSSGVDSLNATSKGKLYFSVHYNEEIQSLSVTINRAEIYVPPHFNGTNSNGNHGKFEFNDNLVPTASKPDSYVKVQLYPDKKRKYQTRIQRKTCTPTFEETFYFYIPYQELSTKSLNLTVLDFGRFTKHSLIGSVRLSDIQSIKDVSSKDIDFCRNLLPLAEDDLELGELTLSLCYLPAAGRLTVTIVKAINLKAMDINGKSDPYVKVTLVSKGKRLKKKKTSVMKNTLNPVYNESMIFDVPQDQIEHVDMVVKVIDYDRVGSNELIGCIGIGPSFDGLGRDHYYRMLENPRKPMTQSYYLRDGTFLRDNLPSKIEKALNTADRQESMDSKGSDQ